MPFYIKMISLHKEKISNKITYHRYFVILFQSTLSSGVIFVWLDLGCHLACRPKLFGNWREMYTYVNESSN